MSNWRCQNWIEFDDGERQCPGKGEYLHPSKGLVCCLECFNESGNTIPEAYKLAHLTIDMATLEALKARSANLKGGL